MIDIELLKNIELEINKDKINWEDVEEFKESAIIGGKLLVVYKSSSNMSQSFTKSPSFYKSIKCAVIDEHSYLVTSEDRHMKDFGYCPTFEHFKYYNRQYVLEGLEATLPFVKDRKKFLSFYISYVLKVDLEYYREPIERLAEIWLDSLGDIPYTLDNRNNLKTKFEMLYSDDSNDVVVNMDDNGNIKVYVTDLTSSGLLYIRDSFDITEFVNCVTGGNIMQLALPLAFMLEENICSATETGEGLIAADIANDILNTIVYIWFRDNCREEDDEDKYYDELNNTIFFRDSQRKLKETGCVSSYLSVVYVEGDEDINDDRARTRRVDEKHLEYVNKKRTNIDPLNGWCRGSE